MPANGLTNIVEDVHVQDMVDLNISGSESTPLSEDEEFHDQTGKFRIASPIECNKLAHTAVEVDPKLSTLPVRAEHEQFLRDCVENILQLAVFGATDRNAKVVEYTKPEELQKRLDLQLKSSGDSHEKLISLMRDVIKYSVKTGHPYFVNQLFSTVDPYGLAGQWLTDALNPSVYTYEVSPVFTLMEETVLAEMRSIIGWSDGDGIFCPGGSISNGYAISCARFMHMPDVKMEGLHNLPRLVVFTSEDSHYSVEKLAAFMGIGARNVYKIKTDACGKLCSDHLEAEIVRAQTEGALPFMVSATAGTTVLGAFDPLEEIADLCKKYNMWMHVDAAWGGGALMSSQYRKLLSGIERADSVTWNPHKLLAAPQQCSAFLTRHTSVLAEAHSANATYLFQKDKCYDTRFDTGDKHIQCGRRADVLKFWFMWRAKGTDGLTAHIENVFHKAEYFTAEIKRRAGFEMVLEHPECTNICFWYVPPSLRGQPRDTEFYERLNAVAPKVKARMMEQGTMMVTYQPLREKPNFFRLVLQNSALTEADMLYFADEIERLAADL